MALDFTTANARRNKLRRGVSLFAAALAEPVAGPFTLPTGCILYVKATSAIAAGETLASIGEREFGSPGMEADQFHCIGYIDAASIITVVAAGEIYIDTGLGNLQKVAGPSA